MSHFMEGRSLLYLFRQSQSLVFQRLHGRYSSHRSRNCPENLPAKLKYRKVPKFSDTRNFCRNLPKIETKRLNLRVFRQKDANGIANSEDPDQTAPLGAVCTGSALFAQTYPKT